MIATQGMQNAMPSAPTSSSFRVGTRTTCTKLGPKSSTPEAATDVASRDHGGICPNHVTSQGLHTGLSETRTFPSTPGRLEELSTQRQPSHHSQNVRQRGRRGRRLPGSSQGCPG